MSVINWFVDNWLSIFATVIGIIVTFCITKFCTRTKLNKVFYIKYHNNILSSIKDKFNSISVKYGRDKITTFSVTKFLIFYNGPDVINKKDISAQDFFGIKVQNGKILDVITLESNLKSLTPKIINNSTVKLGFQYINPKSVIALQVCHTAAKEKGIEFSCSGAGLQKAKCRESYFLKNKRLQWFFSIMFLIVLIFSFLFAYNYEAFNRACMAANNYERFGFAIVLPILYLIPALGAWGVFWRFTYWGKYITKHELWKNKK
jgi:hypothetical protein